jgi:hypothetical protein
LKWFVGRVFGEKTILSFALALIDHTVLMSKARP